MSANPIDIDDPEYLNVDELAAWLKVSKSWIYERVRQKDGVKLPFIKMGHYLRFEKAAVLDFMKRQRKNYLGPNRSQ